MGLTFSIVYPNKMRLTFSIVYPNKMGLTFSIVYPNKMGLTGPFLPHWFLGLPRAKHVWGSIYMKFSMTWQEKGDLLIQATA
jgi:hypothetical protein